MNLLKKWLPYKGQYMWLSKHDRGLNTHFYLQRSLWNLLSEINGEVLRRTLINLMAPFWGIADVSVSFSWISKHCTLRCNRRVVWLVNMLHPLPYCSDEFKPGKWNMELGYFLLFILDLSLPERAVVELASMPPFDMIHFMITYLQTCNRCKHHLT